MSDVMLIGQAPGVRSRIERPSRIPRGKHSSDGLRILRLDEAAVRSRIISLPSFAVSKSAWRK